MADLFEGSVVFNDNVRSAGSVLEKVGTVAATFATAPYKTEENAYYEVGKRIAKVAAVSSLVFGSYNQNCAVKEYNKLDFSNDSYLKEIGVSRDSNAEAVLDRYAASSSLSCVQEAAVNNILSSSGNSFIMAKSDLSNSVLDAVETSGVVNFNGAVYHAREEMGTVRFTAPGQTFDDTNNIKIDIDPLKNITGMTANVTGLSSSEITSAKATGSFTRDHITYRVHGDTENLTPQSTVKISTFVGTGSEAAGSMYAALHTPMRQVSYTMSGDALKGLTRTQLKAIEDNGYYDLGGMKFNATGGIDMKKFNTMYDNVYDKTQNSHYVNSAYAVNDRFSSARSKKEKANAIQMIQSRGADHIRKQSDYLKENFSGSSQSVKKCESHIKGELRKAQHSGNTNEAAKLQSQLDLIKGYKTHGGTIENPSANRRRRAGLMAVGGAVTNREMMRGTQFFYTAGKASTALYRGTRGAVSKLSYMGASTANKVVSKGLQKVAGRDGYAGLTNAKGTIDKLQERNTKRYNTLKEDRMDRARARRNGTMREYRRNKRNERWTAYGDKLEVKIGKADRTQDVFGRKLSDAKKQKLHEKKQRLEARRDRFNKVSRLREDMRKKLDIRGRIRARWKSSRLANSRTVKSASWMLGKLGNVAKGMVGLPSAIMNLIRKILIKYIAGGIVMISVSLFLLLCATALPCYLITKLASWNPIEDMERSLDNYVSIKDRINNNINYQQLIVDIVSNDISADFSATCQVDATWHYLEKKQVPSRNYPWFTTPEFGMINHLWAWEEADNKSRYLTEEDDAKPVEEIYDDNGVLIGSGDLIYGNTYVSSAERGQLPSLTTNLYPIVAMSRFHYWDALSFEQWETVLGYTYYMYVVSHDIAKYDTNYNEGTTRFQIFGDDSVDPGYDYSLTSCAETGSLLYNGTIAWHPDTHTLERPAEQCNNIYIHDFSPVDFTNGVRSSLGEGVPEFYREHNDSHDDLSSFSNAVSQNDSFWSNFTGAGRSIKRKIAEATRSILHSEDNSGLDIVDSWDDGYTDMNSALTLSMRKKAIKQLKIRQGVAEYDHDQFEATIERIVELTNGKVDMDKNMSGIFLYDGTDASLPHSQSKHSGINGENTFDVSVLNAVCKEAQLFCYGISTDTVDDRAEDLLQPGDKGYIEGCHDHTNACYEQVLTCTREEHTHSQSCYDEAGNVTCDISPHTHSDSCYQPDYSKKICGHDHKLWTAADPGCFKTIAICPGHCGEHITPLIDIVEKVTYIGLAEDDNFDTPHWLTLEEITKADGGSAAGVVANIFSEGLFNTLNDLIGDDIMSVAQFRAYWFSRMNKWFSPIPRSPYAFIKKASYAGLNAYLTKIDLVVTSIKTFFSWAGGDGEGTIADQFKENWDSIHDNSRLESTDDKTYTNDSSWEGWWKEPNLFDDSLHDEIAGIFGDWGYEENGRLVRKDGQLYQDGLETSKSLWEEQTLADLHVDFPQHGIHCLMFTEEDIEQYMDIIMEAFPDLTPEQLAILRVALERCGKFGYSLSGAGHTNGAFGDSGMSDCSGFVTGVLMRAFGKSYEEINTNAAGFANRGTYGKPPVPGSIISHTNGGAGYSGHVMIYVGEMDGPEGHGIYVIDCSSSKGGSSLRKMTPAQLARYKYTWNPWEE